MYVKYALISKSAKKEKKKGQSKFDCEKCQRVFDYQPLWSLPSVSADGKYTKQGSSLSMLDKTILCLLSMAFLEMKS